FFQAEDGIRDGHVTGVQTCALPIYFEGGIVSATIKSGTNSFHGDVWEFFRNDVLNAKSWSNNFNNLPKDKIRWNMFGGTLGGPRSEERRVGKECRSWMAPYN